MGCGKGRVSIFLHHYIGCKVIGIDFSEDYIQAANENKHAYNAHADIKFVCQKIHTPWQKPEQSHKQH